MLRSLWKLLLVPNGFSQPSVVIWVLALLKLAGFPHIWRAGWLLPSLLLGLGQPWFSLMFLLLLSSRLAQDYSWQRKQRKREQKLTRQTIFSATFYWPKQVQSQSKLGNRLHFLRRGALKSYYKGHGYRKGSKTAAIFAIDPPYPGIYFLNVHYFM